MKPKFIEPTPISREQAASMELGAASAAALRFLERVCDGGLFSYDETIIIAERWLKAARMAKEVAKR